MCEAVLHCEGCSLRSLSSPGAGPLPTVPPLSRVTPLAVAASISYIFLFRLVVFTPGKKHWSIAPKSRVTKNICLLSGNNVVVVVCLQYNHAFRSHNTDQKKPHRKKKGNTSETGKNPVAPRACKWFIGWCG